MVCWLFVGSWTFASVFSYLGGEGLIADFVIGLDLSPLAFLILAQLIIFLLGWPLEWSEIIIIFVPIFLPLLKVYDIDPLRSEEHTSELQSLMRISYAVFCLKN